MPRNPADALHQAVTRSKVQSAPHLDRNSACLCADANDLTQALLAGKRGAALLATPARQNRRRVHCQVRTQAALDKKKINKVVLAYSGGLDTSVILKWLQETYDCEVVTFTADLGQVLLLPMPIPDSIPCHVGALAMCRAP
jgi:hypothetical protein